MRTRRKGISEITSTLLMTAAVISLGGTVTYQVLGQIGLAQNSAFLGIQESQRSVGELVSLVYASINPSSQLVVEVYNYGTSALTPQTVYVDSGIVVYTMRDASTGATVTSIAPAERVDIIVSSPSFSSATGHSVFLVDVYGNAVQLST